MARPTKKKALPSALPAPGSFLIHKPYAEPVRAARLSDVKRILQADMEKLADRLTFFGNDDDKAAFDELQSEVGKLIEAGEGGVDMVYDSYSGTRYRVWVEVVT